MSAPTVGRLLNDLGYALHVNAKKNEASSNHPERDRQFDYIAVQRATFTAAGLPILSVDTKKKELVGDFKNAGQAWGRQPTAVNVHDYPHDAVGRAVPYGVYDVTNNHGLICLGASGDTPAFAADAIAAWWQTEGQASYAADTDHLLLLANAGGSNGCRIRAWKERLQVEVCDRFGLTVTVCHYPTGCSKWNPSLPVPLRYPGNERESGPGRWAALERGCAAGLSQPGAQRLTAPCSSACWKSMSTANSGILGSCTRSVFTYTPLSRSDCA